MVLDYENCIILFESNSEIMNFELLNSAVAKFIYLTNNDVTFDLINISEIRSIANILTIALTLKLKNRRLLLLNYSDNIKSKLHVFKENLVFA